MAQKRKLRLFSIEGGRIEKRWSFHFRDRHTTEKYFSLISSSIRLPAFGEKETSLVRVPTLPFYITTYLLLLMITRSTIA